MNQGDFDAMVRQTARPVTITRGAVTLNNIMMASTIGAGDNEIMQDATQDDILVTLLASQFTSTALQKPDRYDRITDANGRNYAIQLVKDVYGVSGQLWGFKAIIRGNE